MEDFNFYKQVEQTLNTVQAHALAGAVVMAEEAERAGVALTAAFVESYAKTMAADRAELELALAIMRKAAAAQRAMLGQVVR